MKANTHFFHRTSFNKRRLCDCKLRCHWYNTRKMQKVNKKCKSFEVPSWRAKTMSLSITVGIRWATVTTVQFENPWRIIRCRMASVVLSIEAVASSRTRIRLCFNNARPKQKSWRCPTLQLSPSSVTATKHTQNNTLNKSSLSKH